MGEVFLLGGALLVGELLILSLIGAYRAPYLWAAVLANYLFLFSRTTRGNLSGSITKGISFKIPLLIFIGLLLLFIFRNCYFTMDIDSFSTYLNAQKLWLSDGTSLTGSMFSDMRIFAPHFDVVPSSLGLSIFGKETLFPQLINLFWRLVVLLLAFGYTSYRFNKWLGLASVMFILFNDHFFYSGINNSVLINGALIAFLFAAAYNFWEGRVQNSPFRFLLAVIFLSQLMANKYQMFYVLFFLTGIGIFIQLKPLDKLKQLTSNKRRLIAICIAFFNMSLWYLKNIIATGTPVFPVLAGRLGIFNWTVEREQVFGGIFGGLNLLKFIKYMNFLFIWPGIKAAKYIIITLSFFPLLLTVAAVRSKLDRNSLSELCYWLGLSIITIMGICLVSHQDPRYFRYPIGILSFTAILSFHYVFTNCLNIKNKLLSSGLILLISLSGYSVIYRGFLDSPTFEENISVLRNKIHTDYIVDKHYPQVKKVLKAISANKDKFDTVAYSSGINAPFFLLPDRPLVSIWLNSVIGWDSYDSQDLIVQDLKKSGIEWILKINSNDLSFLSVKDYARQAVEYGQVRHRTGKFFNYNLPRELIEIK